MASCACAGHYHYPHPARRNSLGAVTNARLRPGDFGLAHMSGDTAKLIRLGQFLNGNGLGDYEHAFVYVGGNQIVEAEPHGAALNRYHYSPGAQVLWSSGLIELTDAQRNAIIKAAKGYVGVPYSWADYAALGLHRFGINLPGLQSYIESDHSMICSQLVDQCYQDAGVHLFTDHRWPGYVTPGDLWQLLMSKR